MTAWLTDTSSILSLSEKTAVFKCKRVQFQPFKGNREEESERLKNILSSLLPSEKQPC